MLRREDSRRGVETCQANRADCLEPNLDSFRNFGRQLFPARSPDDKMSIDRPGNVFVKDRLLPFSFHILQLKPFLR